MEALKDRRTFLKHSAAAAAVVLGAPVLAWAAPPVAKEADALRMRGVRAHLQVGDGSDPLPDALTQAKAENKPILAVLLPTDPLTSTQIASAFPELLASKDKRVRRVFCEAVFAILPTKAAATHFPKHKADGRILCLDPQGGILDELDSATDLSAENFAPAMTLLLHGKDGARLTKLVDAQTKALDESARKKLDGLVKDLGSEDFKVRENATKEMLTLAPQCTALLAQTHAATRDPEVKQRTSAILDHVFESAKPDQPGPRRIHGLLAGAIQSDHPSPPCGAVKVWPHSQIFLSMLTDGG